ncbi:MAG: hypothetical protein ACYTEO_14915 [Planctomycetota bacterium]|jgi:hypothetical protein
MNANLIAMMSKAQDIQDWWNGLTKEQRSWWLFNHNEDMCSIFHIAAIETECLDCLKRMDTSTTPIPCEFCGGKTCSPYYF